MGDIVSFHAAACGKRSGRKSETGMPVRSETIGTSLPSILRAPVSQRVTVGRETPRVSANSPCESPCVARYTVNAEMALIGHSVPIRHPGCQVESVIPVLGIDVPKRYNPRMDTSDRPFGYLYIAERMNALGLKDTAVAEACGETRPIVNRWRNGERRPGTKKIARLAEALQCNSPLDLLLPPGKMVVIIDVPKQVPHEKPPDSPPVRPPRRVRQRQPRASRRA